MGNAANTAITVGTFIIAPVAQPIKAIVEKKYSTINHMHMLHIHGVDRGRRWAYATNINRPIGNVLLAAVPVVSHTQVVAGAVMKELKWSDERVRHDIGRTVVACNDAIVEVIVMKAEISGVVMGAVRVAADVADVSPPEHRWLILRTNTDHWAMALSDTGVDASQHTDFDHANQQSTRGLSWKGNPYHAGVIMSRHAVGRHGDTIHSFVEWCNANVGYYDFTHNHCQHFTQRASSFLLR